MPTTRHSIESSRCNKEAGSSIQQKKSLPTVQVCTRHSAGLARKVTSENVMLVQKGNCKSPTKSRHSHVTETANMDGNSFKCTMATRRSKRTTESLNVVPDKKQKLESGVKETEPENSKHTQVPKVQVSTPTIKVLRGKSRYSEHSVDPPSEIENADLVDKSRITKISTEHELKITDKTSTKVIKARLSANETTSSPKSSTSFVHSPRRSSRTVIPNTRYKDMVDPLKKTAVVKPEIVKTEAVKTEVVKTGISSSDTIPQKMMYPEMISLPLDMQEEPTNNVIEEVVTEDTNIDTFAQINLTNEDTASTQSTSLTATNDVETSSFDNTCITEDNTCITEDNTCITEDNTCITEDNTCITEERNSGIQIIQIENDSSVNAEPVEEQEGNDATDIGAVSVKDGQKLSSFGGLPEPQVIVIPNESGKTASKIIIPKDPYRARLEQAFENKSSSMIFGPSTGKFKTRKLIVTPTHTHTSKKEAQKAKMARQAEAASSESNNSSTSLLYPWMQHSGVSTGQIIHTPDKPSVEVISQQETIDTTSAVGQTKPITSGNVILQCNEEALDFPAGDSGPNKTSTSQAIQHVKIVYVKAKSGPDGTKSVTVDTVSAADIKLDGKDEEASSIVPSIKSEAVTNQENKSEVESEATIYEEVDSTDKLVAVSESSNIGTTHILTDESVNSANKTGEKSIPDLPIEQKIANTLCQVVEYKEQRPHHQPSSTIEYVLLDNKMVPIHKPYTIGPHGRIHTGRQTFPQRMVPGRIEGGCSKTQIPVSDDDLLSAVHATVAQTGGTNKSLIGNQTQPVGGDTVCSAEESQMSVTAVDEHGRTIQIEQPLVTHYIDQPMMSSSPPQIVEISTEAFTKEVLGDGFTLDPASGELLSGSIVVADGNQIIQSQTGVTDSLNQSEVCTVDHQSGLEQDVAKIGNQTVGLKESVVEWSENTSTEITGKPTTSTLLPIQNDGNIFLESVNYYNDGEILTQNSAKTGENKTGSVVVQVETAQGGGKVTTHGTGKVPRVVKVKIHSKQPTEPLKEFPTETNDTAIQKLPFVNITPVRAHTKENGEVDNPKQMVTKATATDAFDEEDELRMPDKEGKSSKGQQYEEYIVVHLPEGTEIKQFHARPRQENSTGEAITLDSDGMYICVDCGHKTDRRGNWMKHRRKHLGIRPHACPKCSYKAATSSNLKRHLQIHDDIRNFQCHYCNLLFRQKIHLERHLKYKHEEKNVKCPLCDYVCSSENPDLKIHIRRRHMPHDGALNAFTCDICNLMTVSKKDLKQHMKFHKNGPELKLFCEHCSFVTDCVSRLRRHMLIHTKERPFQCGMCSYRASQKEHVLRHMRSQHGVEVERNQRRSLLSKNEDADSDAMLVAGSSQSATSVADTGTESEFGPFEKSDFSSTDKIFACNYCSMKFAKLINLYKHLYAQHKNIMPEEGPNDYQCVVCDFRTNSKKNLLVHMRKHNMKDHSPPTHVYSCVLCRYMNPRRRNLFQHMKKKHGIEIIMKDDGLNCYVTLDSNAAQVQGQDAGKMNVMALSDIVTTQTMDDITQLEFVCDLNEDSAALHAEKISIDSIIPIEEMGSYVVSDTSQEHETSVHQVSIGSSLHPSVQEHEAAEAIEGLQALAEQAGILETQNVDNDMTAEIVAPTIDIAATEIMNDGEIGPGQDMLEPRDTIVEHTAEETENVQMSPDQDLQLSSEQLNQLSSGDYVEINGEVYKVEIAPEQLQQTQ